MKVKELLDAAAKWTKGWNAKDKHGALVPSHADTACMWCLNGAIERCYPESEQETILARVLAGLGITPVEYNLGWGKPVVSQAAAVMGWNDNPCRTFGQVKQLVNDLDI